MKEFMLLFRFPDMDFSKVSPKDMESIARKWKDWSAGIGDRMVSGGNRLALEGKVLHAGGVITDGPFVEIKEKLGSFIVVRAENLDEATTLAHGCPILEQDGSVEIRPIFGQ